MVTLVKSVAVRCSPSKGLFTYDVSQKWGFADPPSPPYQPKSEIGLPPLPPLSENIRNCLGTNLAFENNLKMCKGMK